MLRQSYNVDFGYIHRYLKLSVLWLHILFRPVMRVDRITGRNKYAATIPHRNFGEAKAESSLMMVYVYGNMLEQLL